MTADKLVRLGAIAGVYGVKGWVKVRSFTEPRANIVEFEHWMLAQHGRRWQVGVAAGRGGTKQVLAKLAGVDDRDAAAELIGAEIYVPRAALPACGPDEYYWADLEGLEVCGRGGAVLGRVDHLIETGAHDVMVLEGSGDRLIPFVLDEIVLEVDLERGLIVVDWDESFWSE